MTKSEHNMERITVDNQDAKEQVDSTIYNTLLKNLPAFIELKKTKKYAGPLSKYAKCPVSKFIADYKYSTGIKGKEVYDALYHMIVPHDEDKGNDANTEINYTNTTFPEKFDERISLGNNLKQAICELIKYYEIRPTEKNKKRGIILDALFHQALSPKQIQEQYTISLTTILDNYLNPLFRTGEVDEIKLDSVFYRRLKECVEESLYHSVSEFEEAFAPCDIAPIISAYALAIYSKKDYYPDAILIRKGDDGKITACLKGVIDVMSTIVTPLVIDDILPKTEQLVGSGKWLPVFVENVLSNHPAIEKEGNQYILKRECLREKADRIARIVYDSPNHSAKRSDVEVQYKALYGEDLKSIPNSETLNAKNVFIVKDGAYVYSENPIVGVNDTIDKYIQDNICFSWADLYGYLVEKYDKDILNEGSLKAYAQKQCSTCKTKGVDQMVLKGHEGDFNNFVWSDGRKTDMTNIIINRAVEIIKANGSPLLKNTFFDQLEQEIVAEGIRKDRVKTVINKYMKGIDNDPILFVETDNGCITTNDSVIETINLDYFALGYKYADYYVYLYALAISELQKADNHQMLRSDFFKYVLNDLKIEGITNKIIRKAFDSSDKLPQLLTLTGSGRDTYIVLDDALLKSDEAKEIQYKVSDTATTHDSLDTPVLVVDSKKRTDLSYKQKFTWDEVLDDLKHDLGHYNAPYFYPGITSDESLEKFKRCLSQSKNVYLNTIVPQAYYDLNNAMVERWTCFDFLTKITLSFESLLTDIYYQNRGVDSQTRSLSEIFQLAYHEFETARKNHDRTGFNGIVNNIYRDRNSFAHTSLGNIPTISYSTKTIISYMALFVYTVSKYYKG